MCTRRLPNTGLMCTLEVSHISPLSHIHSHPPHCTVVVLANANLALQYIVVELCHNNVIFCLCVAPSSSELADFDMKLKQLLNMGISEVCVCWYMYM